LKSIFVTQIFLDKFISWGRISGIVLESVPGRQMGSQIKLCFELSLLGRFMTTVKELNRLSEQVIFVSGRNLCKITGVFKKKKPTEDTKLLKHS